MRWIISVSVALAVIVSTTHAQNPWGNPGVLHTTFTTHTTILAYTEAAAGAGMNPPPVAGSPGSTTIGGVATYTFNSEVLSDWNFAGTAMGSGTNGAIAFNTQWWWLSEPGTSNFTWGVILYVAVAYHEIAHIVYQTFVTSWAAANPGLWSAYSDCIKNLKNPDGTSKGFTGKPGDKAPCDEAYAYSVSSVNLCHDKQDVCDNGDLSPDKKAKLIEEIDKQIAAMNGKCGENSSDCSSCNGPMPEGWGGCPGPCVCN